MTREEAIKILDPETRLEYLVEVEYKAGFRGAGAVADAMKEALDMATAALREQGGSFQNGNDHNTVKDWPPYMDLPRERDVTDINVGSKWISVDERLPENNDKVLAFTLSGKYAVARYDQRRQCWIAAGNLTVTHWMPLPDVPEVEI